MWVTKTLGTLMELKQTASFMLCLYCKDAQVAEGGSQCVFLSITKHSLINTDVQRAWPSSSLPIKSAKP